MTRICIPCFAIALWMIPLCSAAKPKKDSRPSSDPIASYTNDAEQRSTAGASAASPGSLFFSNGVLANTVRDMRALQVDDLVTVQVNDRATALAKGVSNTQRKSSAKYGISSLFGPTKVTGALANLANASGDSQLQGQGQTSRDSTFSTTLSARVTHVLPNGYLVIEGVKNVAVNSDMQTVRVRGVVRPSDVSPGNVISSDRLAQLDIEINGRGVVGDAIKRPFFLYRILMGLLPF